MTVFNLTKENFGSFLDLRNKIYIETYNINSGDLQRDPLMRDPLYCFWSLERTDLNNSLFVSARTLRAFPIIETL